MNVVPHDPTVVSVGKMNFETSRINSVALPSLCIQKLDRPCSSPGACKQNIQCATYFQTLVKHCKSPAKTDMIVACAFDNIAYTTFSNRINHSTSIGNHLTALQNSIHDMNAFGHKTSDDWNQFSVMATQHLSVTWCSLM